jgi:nitroimidazol reductase NimA-like FMN-containing flavoprotein (pyridoxamine 5'-phosphate oxidase superfamily)
MSNEDAEARPALRGQRRSRRVAMTSTELDAFLAQERTCRVGTLSPDGPHVTPLWFAWDGSLLWIYSIVRSQRWADVLRDPRVAVVVDTGHHYFELRGAEIRGTVAPVGEVPRTGEPNERLAAVEEIFAARYRDGAPMEWDRRHGWLCLTPEKITSWDFRKISAPAS